MTDPSLLIRVIKQTQPGETYNLAAQSRVAVSFEEPTDIANSDAMGVLRILETIRIPGLAEKTRFYQTSTRVPYSVRDFVDAAADELGMKNRRECEWIEAKRYAAVGRRIGAVDSRYFGPTELETLLGNPGKVKQKHGWTLSTSFADLVAKKVREELKAVERDELIKKSGFKAVDYHD